jgi:uncharacterized protein YyaL (SSP411 family)
MDEMLVPWLHWGKKAFYMAEKLDKPILLDISAVWCHWCHMIDRTAYSDKEVAKIIIENYVPVRVDRDQRPDIDKRYNMGGWPTMALLTPRGEVITGATYVPPYQMKQLLMRTNGFYKENRDKIRAESVIPEKVESNESPVEHGLEREFFESVVDNLVLEIASSFDSVNGGFGNAAKFPNSEALSLSLLEYHLRGHRALLEIATKTLQKMSASGTYDREEGGFFRYSTTADWSTPHYEKMCEDNAKLLINYLEAYQVTGKETFKETVNGIITYVDSTLCDQNNGGFYGSQDADEEYYRFGRKARMKKSIPRVDKTIYTNWNAAMVSAYLLASAVIDPSYRKIATRTIDFLLEKCASPKNGMYHCFLKGKGYLPGLLTDQALMIKCLVDTYQATSDEKFLNHAEKIADFLLNELQDVQGGFYDRPEEAEAFGALKTLLKPLDENSAAVDSLIRLYYLTGKERYLGAARRALDYLASNYQSHGIMAAPYGLAIELFLHPVQVHIVGTRGDPTTIEFLKESSRVYNPLKVIEILDPVDNADKLTSLGLTDTKKPRAYICMEGTCVTLDDPSEISRKILPKKV